MMINDRDDDVNIRIALMVVRLASNQGESVRVTHAAQSPDGVLGNTAEAESANPGSNPGLVSMMNDKNEIMLALAYLVKCHTVNVENRVRVPVSTKKENATWCKRQHIHLPSFLEGKHKKDVSSSNLEGAQNWLIV